MSLKQTRALTFTEMNVLGNICQCDLVHIILLYVGKNLTDPFVFCKVRCSRYRMMRNVFCKQPPHDLHLYGNIQFIEGRFLFVERDDFQHMIPKSRMPVFTIINMDGTYSEILDDRIDIFGTDSTLKESIDQLRIKCDWYIGTILFYVCVFFTIYSGYDYFAKNMQVFRNAD